MCLCVCVCVLGRCETIICKFLIFASLWVVLRTPVMFGIFSGDCRIYNKKDNIDERYEGTSGSVMVSKLD